VKELEEKGTLDDEKFVENKIMSMRSAGKSQRGIMAALRLKGVENELTLKVLKRLEGQEDGEDSLLLSDNEVTLVDNNHLLHFTHTTHAH